MIRVNPRLSNIIKILGGENFIWWDLKPGSQLNHRSKSPPAEQNASRVVKMAKGWVGKFQIWIEILRMIWMHAHKSFLFR